MSSILIIDDEAGVRASLGGVLRDEGYQVDAVDSGEACLEKVTRQAYDVMLLDIWLPGIDGLVEHAQVLAPPDLERIYGLSGGHIYHGEPSLDQLFTMRPVLGCARYLTPIPGLFLCGSGTHPGGGITGGPGQNAAREILTVLK
jgi:phytoene dehydrogenase-like protein